MAPETHFALRQQLVRVSPRKLGEVATPREVGIREPDLAFLRLQILDVDPFRVLSDRDLGDFAVSLALRYWASTAISVLRMRSPAAAAAPASLR
jgi:hypothetical protein